MQRHREFVAVIAHLWLADHRSARVDDPGDNPRKLDPRKLDAGNADDTGNGTRKLDTRNVDDTRFDHGDHGRM